jgi:hypothetical protein
MKKLLFTAMLSMLFMTFSTLTANARLVNYTDLWDVIQGTVVTDSSGALLGSWSSDPRNMFGGTYGSGPADLTNNTIFQDHQPAGYVHWVNWSTSAPVTLQSFNLVAGHDYDSGLNPYGEYRDINYRGISRFRLFWGDGSGTWTLLYDHTVNPVQDQGGHPTYGGGANYTGLGYLELSANVPLTTAQYFRAEFTQYGSGSNLFGDAQGPRILELDGYGPDSAGPDSVDDFNDNIMDPAKWGTDDVKGRGQLNETNGRLEYTCGGGSGVSSSDRPWKLTKFPYDAPWEIVIDATNTTSPTGKQWSSFGIVVENAKNEDDWIEVELAASEQSHMFWAEFYDNNAYSGDASAGAMSTSAPIRISFNNVTKVFTLSYFDGAVWNSLGTFGVNGSGGFNGNAMWGMTDSDHFVAYVFGYSENMTVNDGEMYGDNFQETGGVEPPRPEITSPANGIIFDTCSYFAPPLFQWNLPLTFQKLELQFYTSANPAKPTKVKVKDPAATQLQMPANIWKKILNLPGLSGGELNWKIVGMNKGQPAVESNVYTMTIAAPEPVGTPTITPTRQTDLPTLGWGNACATKFKVYFSPDTTFSRKKTLSFTDKNPVDNGEYFSTTLVTGTWNAIRKLVNDEAGLPIYWYVESWDVLRRYQRTENIQFTLEP